MPWWENLKGGLHSAHEAMRSPSETTINVMVKELLDGCGEPEAFWALLKEKICAETEIPESD